MDRILFDNILVPFDNSFSERFAYFTQLLNLQPISTLGLRHLRAYLTF